MAQKSPDTGRVYTVQLPSLGLWPGLPTDWIPRFGSLQQFGFIKYSCTSKWCGPAQLGPMPLENH